MRPNRPRRREPAQSSSAGGRSAGTPCAAGFCQPSGACRPRRSAGSRTADRRCRGPRDHGRQSASAAPPLQLREADAIVLHSGRGLRTIQNGALDRRRHRGAYQTIKPMIVAPLGPQLPFVDLPAATFGADAVFGGEVLSEEPMTIRIIAEQRETSAVAHGHRQPRVDEALPVVGVEDNVPDGPFALHVGDPPVVADSITGAPLVFAEGLARCADEPSVCVR